MDKDPLGIAVLIAFPLAFIILYGERLRYLLAALSQYWFILLLLVTLAILSLLQIRGRGLRGIASLGSGGRTVALVKVNIYDKNTSIDMNKIKEIAESMGIGIIFLVSIDGGRKLMGRSLGRRAGCGAIMWANAESGRETIRAAASAINSFSDGFKLEIIEGKRLNYELISSLLSMTSEGKEAISIELGRELRKSDVIIELGERKGKVIGINPEDLTKHVLLAGQTGSGKTTTIKRIVYEAWNLGVPSVILDSHWEYKNLVFQLGGRIYFNRPGYPQICVNPLASIPKGEREVFLVAETLSTLLDLTPSQFYLLLKALRRLSDLSSEKNPPNMMDLILEVRGMVSSSQPEEESRASLVRKLEPLVSGGGEELFSCDNILSTGFEESLTLIELGDIESDLQKQLLSFFILKRVKNRFIREEGKSKFPRLLVVLEEAEKLIPKYKDAIGLELMSRLFAELRKFGISLIMASQSLSEIPEAAIRNTGVKVIHRIESPSDLRLLRPSSSEKNFTERIATLMPGECVLMLPYGLEVLQVRPVDELPLRRERIEEVIRRNSFYWPSSHPRELL